MTALDGLKDIWHNLWQCGEVRLGQRLFHLLNLHQTQCPLIPYNITKIDLFQMHSLQNSTAIIPNGYIPNDWYINVPIACMN